MAPLLSWQDWLRVQGERGDMTALAVLRSREWQQADMRRNLLTSEQAEKARQSLLRHLKPQVRRDGAVACRTGDGGLVLDRGANIEAGRKEQAKREAARQAAALQEWIKGRNETRAAGADMLPHRQWTERDGGETVYRGTRTMPDGSKAVLLERGNQMLVKPADAALLKQAEGWKIGAKVTVGRERRRSREGDYGMEM